MKRVNTKENMMKTMNKIAVSIVAVVALSTGAYATCASDVDMGGNTISNVADPISNTDVANKQYVDGAIAESTNIDGYGTIAYGGKVWLDRNLGATLVATSPTDHRAYGDLFQWGRSADGHQIIQRTNATTASALYGTTSTNADVPTDSLFITEDSSPHDWRVNQNTDLWKTDGTGTNEVCPNGFRLPTEAEFTSLGLSDSQDAYNKIKLTVAGNRHYSNGTLRSVGSYGDYWTSSVSGSYSRSLDFDSSAARFYSNYRVYGFSVRCIKH